MRFNSLLLYPGNVRARRLERPATHPCRCQALLPTFAGYTWRVVRARFGHALRRQPKAPGRQSVANQPGHLLPPAASTSPVRSIDAVKHTERHAKQSFRSGPACDYGDPGMWQSSPHSYKIVVNSIVWTESRSRVPWRVPPVFCARKCTLRIGSVISRTEPHSGKYRWQGMYKAYHAVTGPDTHLYILHAQQLQLYTTITPPAHGMNDLMRRYTTVPHQLRSAAITTMQWPTHQAGDGKGLNRVGQWANGAVALEHLGSCSHKM
jgi:hypothetical protein